MTDRVIHYLFKGEPITFTMRGKFMDWLPAVNTIGTFRGQIVLCQSVKAYAENLTIQLQPLVSPLVQNVDFDAMVVSTGTSR